MQRNNIRIINVFQGSIKYGGKIKLRFIYRREMTFTETSGLCTKFTYFIYSPFVRVIGSVKLLTLTRIGKMWMN